MLITDGIHQIDRVKGAHVYLITGEHPFLVDTGLPGQGRRVLNYLSQVGLNPSDLKAIVLTHYDVDHVGSAVSLQQLTGCNVYAHETEIPYLQQALPRPGIKRWLPMLITPVYGRLELLQNISPLNDGDIFSGWECLHTPGHTPGHLVLYRNGIVLAGDLMQGGTIRLAPSFFTWEASALRSSITNLLQRPVRWILPGHGPATPASAHWLDKLQNELSN